MKGAFNKLIAALIVGVGLTIRFYGHVVRGFRATR
jgi:hypothetical protein